MIPPGLDRTEPPIEETQGALPTYIIIGAAKCGTTSLHRYLGAHPEIQASTKKELKVFSREDWRDHLGWYRSQFSPAYEVRGEASPTYTAHPSLPHAAERIRAVVPDAKLIYLVRDPIERFVAHYVEEYSLGFESRSIEAVARDVESQTNRSVWAGMYAFQLERFLALFDPAQIHVIDQDALRGDRRSTLREAFGFLGVDPDFTDPQFDRLHNATESKMRLTWAGRQSRRRGWLPAIRTRAEALPTPIGRSVIRLLEQPAPAPSLAQETRGALERAYASDVARLRELTGKSFAGWSV